MCVFVCVATVGMPSELTRLLNMIRDLDKKSQGRRDVCVFVVVVVAVDEESCSSGGIFLLCSSDVLMLLLLLLAQSHRKT